MNRMYKKVLIIMMAVIAFYQAILINKINNEKNVAVYNNVNKTIVNHKNLKDINEELSCLKEKNILSANEIDGKWHVKVKIHGNKEELADEMSKLINYDICDYIINRSKEENSIVLEICSKENE